MVGLLPRSSSPTHQIQYLSTVNLHSLRKDADACTHHQTSVVLTCEAHECAFRVSQYAVTPRRLSSTSFDPWGTKHSPRLQILSLTSIPPSENNHIQPSTEHTMIRVVPSNPSCIYPSWICSHSSRALGLKHLGLDDLRGFFRRPASHDRVQYLKRSSICQRSLRNHAAI